jgi:hypothetical protein
MDCQSEIIPNEGSIYKPLDSSRREIRVLWICPNATTSTAEGNPEGKSDRDSEQDEAPIRVELVTVSLLDKPAYVALSYVWGSPEDVGPRIFVNDQEFGVRRNLHDCLLALQRKRIGTKPDTNGPAHDAGGEDEVGFLRGIPLWIDALCINQDDIAERSHQVLLMGDIFRNAAGVVSWLGSKEDEYGKVCVEALRRVREIALQWLHSKKITMEQLKNEQTTPLKANDDMSTATTMGENTSSDPIFTPWSPIVMAMAKRFTDTTRHIWNDDQTVANLVALFLNPYWQRTWIVQELALASPGLHVYICNDATLTATDLQEFAECILTVFDERARTTTNPLEFGQTAAADISGTAWMLVTRTIHSELVFHRLLLDIHHGRVKPGWGFVLFVAGRRRCTDPRDVVYGLLELIRQPSSSVNEDPMIPDYSLSVRQVYVDWALRTLRQFGDLRLLGYASKGVFDFLRASGLSGEQNPDFELPSWVPDLYRAQHPYPLPLVADQGSDNTRDGINASSFVANVTPEGFLIVRARRRAVISRSTQFDSTGNTSKEHISYRFCVDYLRSRQGLAYPAKGLTTLRALMNLLLRQKLGLLDPSEADPRTGKQIHHLAVVFIAFIVGFCVKTSLDCGDGQLVDAYGAASMLGISLEDDFCRTYQAAMFPEADVKSLMGWCDHWEDVIRMFSPTLLQTSFADIHGELAPGDKCLFTTENGHIGRTGHPLQEGDLVYDVEHSPYLLVFRKTGRGEGDQNHVVLMDACDVSGILDGFDDVEEKGPEYYDEELVIC